MYTYLAPRTLLPMHIRRLADKSLCRALPPRPPTARPRRRARSIQSVSIPFSLDGPFAPCRSCRSIASSVEMRCKTLSHQNIVHLTFGCFDRVTRPWHPIALVRGDKQTTPRRAADTQSGACTYRTARAWRAAASRRDPRCVDHLERESGTKGRGATGASRAGQSAAPSDSWRVLADRHRHRHRGPYSDSHRQSRRGEAKCSPESLARLSLRAAGCGCAERTAPQSSFKDTRDIPKPKVRSRENLTSRTTGLTGSGPGPGPGRTAPRSGGCTLACAVALSSTSRLSRADWFFGTAAPRRERLLRMQRSIA